MSYEKIPNLYSDSTILDVCKQVYALEKVHGTPAQVSWHSSKLHVRAAGVDHEDLVCIFDMDGLQKRFTRLGRDRVVVYGEVYGGGMQGMVKTYGDTLRFVAFEVTIDGIWLAVNNAADVAAKLGLEYVPYELVPATLEAIDKERDRPSVIADRRGTGVHIREGVVLRPTIELRRSNGDRLIAKHRRDEFRETASPRVVDSERQARWVGAEKIADEFVTDMRLRHVLDRLRGDEPGIVLSKRVMPEIIKRFIADVRTEEGATIEWTKETSSVMGSRVADLFDLFLKREKFKSDFEKGILPS